MCLEAIGNEDDDECNGKAVGQPCTHSESLNAMCTHDPRSGAWMCSAPKTEEPVFAVCEGQEKGTPCTYTAKIDPRFDHGVDSGLIQGECDLHDETHTAMMCLASDHLHDKESTTSAPDEDEEKDAGSPVTLIIAVAAASLVVGCCAGALGLRVMQKSRQRKEPATVSQPDRSQQKDPDGDAGISAPPQMASGQPMMVLARPVGNGQKDHDDEQSLPSNSSSTRVLIQP